MDGMTLSPGEEVLFTSKNKDFFFTTLRLRSIHKSIFGSEIKSILLDELTSCEIKTIIPLHILPKVIIFPILINGIAFLINNYLFKSSLLQLFFDEVQIESSTLLYLFYISMLIAGFYLFKFFLSIRRRIRFYSQGLTIDVQLRSLNFAEKVNLINQVEEAKLKRTNLKMS